MGKLELVIESDNVSIYSPKYDGETQTEFEKFMSDNGSLPQPQLKKDFEAIIAVIKKMLDYRIHEKFIMEDGSFNQTTCGYYETKPLMELGMKPDNTIQSVADMTIYSSDFFHPYDYMSGETCITDNTYSIHHFNGGWLDEKSMIERKRTVEQYKNMLVRMNVTDG